MNKSIFLTLLFICIVFTVSAQPDLPNNGSPTPFGFIELLIGAGALYGGKKLHDYKKEKAE